MRNAVSRADRLLPLLIAPEQLERLSRAIVAQTRPITAAVVADGDTREARGARGSWFEFLLVHVGDTLPPDRLKEIAADLDAKALDVIAVARDNPDGPLPANEQAERWVIWLRRRLAA